MSRVSRVVCSSSRMTRRWLPGASPCRSGTRRDLPRGDRSCSQPGCECRGRGWRVGRTGRPLACWRPAHSAHLLCRIRAADFGREKQAGCDPRVCRGSFVGCDDSRSSRSYAMNRVFGRTAALPVRQGCLTVQRDLFSATHVSGKKRQLTACSG